jgi:hypothetical protein
MPCRDIVGLMAARIGDHIDQPGRLIGGIRSRFDRPGMQPVDALRHQHADADLLDELSDPLDVTVFALVLAHGRGL